MKAKRLILIFSIFVAGLVFAQPVAYLSNGFIEVGATASNGMFCIGTPTAPLMYGEPRSGGNSSHTIFYIDGNLYSNDPFVEPPAVPIPIEEPAHISGGSIIAKWVQNGITITQMLQPVMVITGTDTTGTVNIQYTFINNDTLEHRVGLLSTIDLYVGGRDDAPISVPGYPFVDTALVFAGGSVPQFWRAYSRGPEFPDSEQVVAQCNLYDPAVPMPDYLVFGNNRDILSASWNYTPPPHERYDDAGVLIRWNNIRLSPDSVVTIRYSFGIAPSTATIRGALSMRIEAPARLGFYNCTMIPNPFLITVRVTNTTLGTAESVRARIILPDGLQLEGSPQTQLISPNPNLPSAITGYATWSVRALPPLSTSFHLHYTIIVTSTTVDSNFATDSVFVPFSTYRGPDAEIRVPENNTFTSDTRQEVRFYLKDDDVGVDTTKIRFKLAIGMVDTTSYHYSRDTLFFEGDSILVFRRPGGYRNGDVATAILLEAPDFHGCPVDTTLMVRFIVDAAGPRLLQFYPESGAVINNSTTKIRMQLEDDISGVKLSSIDFTLNGVRYPFDNRILTYQYDTTIYGRCLYFDPIEAYGTGFPDGTYRVCLNDATDSVNYGAPNHLVGAPWCWTFTVNAHGPIARLISPPSGTITSCANQSIRFTLEDGNGLNLSSLTFTINGYPYGISALRTIDDTTFEYIPPAEWLNGETVNFALTACQDNLRTPLSAPLNCSFRVDLRPPEILNVLPAPNDTVGEPFPIIMATLVDSIAGIVTNSIRVVAGRDTFNYGHRAIQWDPPFLSFYLDLAGYPSPTAFDTVRICIIASDSATICPPNTRTLCWSFFRLIEGPTGRSLNDTLLCDGFMPLRFILSDREGVLSASIRLTIVSPSESLDFRVGPPNLSYANDTLTFTPSSRWREGVSYRACISEATDEVGNPISAPICASFRVDASAPNVLTYFPQAPEINDTLQPITIIIQDSARATVPSSIVFIVLNDTLRLGSPGLTFSNDTLRFDPGIAHTVYPVRDTVRITLIAYDRCGHGLIWQHSWYETFIKGDLLAHPTSYSIVANYPNPFNTGTNILISIPKTSVVTVDILNVMGERVCTLFSGILETGYHSFFWDGKDRANSAVSSGLYFIRMSSPSGVNLRTMILLK